MKQAQYNDFRRRMKRFEFNFLAYGSPTKSVRMWGVTSRRDRRPVRIGTIESIGTGWKGPNNQWFNTREAAALALEKWALQGAA